MLAPPWTGPTTTSTTMAESSGLTTGRCMDSPTTSSLKRSYTAMVGDHALDLAGLSRIFAAVTLAPASSLTDVRPDERLYIEAHLVRLLRTFRPDAPAHVLQKLPSLARKLDAILFRLAPTKADYMDSATLYRRLVAIGDAVQNKKRKAEATTAGSPDDDGRPPMFKLFSESLSRIDRTADNAGFAFTAVDINGKELGSLDQIKDFRHLRFVNVARNKLSDASPVTALEYLVHLNLAENSFREIPKLKNAHLKALDVSKNQLTALTGGESKSLEALKVNGNAITSLTGLGDFPALKALEISQNAIAELAVFENQLTNLNGLGAFPNLTSFKAELNNMTTLADLAALGALTKLQDVDLTGNAVTEVEHYRLDMLLLLPKLSKLDGIAITDDERLAAIQLHADRTAAPSEDEP
ncbi:hypothetical protein SPRG_10996 [Saprolegnia parasitica CBS 223.65]|uniref:Leucine-rich repeat domain-containing protein n=1 Tax=Saprolegnia parasitica (strain CBS 223.65) TaxID=695850 RepID=A0A067C7D7_SAPPC|nr:hypothetical protein SPRG_10996 [Saprolegnia parasitica CBS 223.65]KDO22682.1 hypothetical protein SPRG_10996 [Saprolegnia parasitica CBS 223.65]|eukprot:XP_012206597.1 hypothetical protein SPRG_10996 [Saprolegnia parasitica CBS 223.65]